MRAIVWAALAQVVVSGLVAADGVSGKFSRKEALAIRTVRCVTAQPRVGQVCELQADVGCTCDDPFNPSDVAVTAQVKAPTRNYAMPGFYYARADGASEWRVRFLPMEAGEHLVTIEARDRSGSARSEPVKIRVAPGEWHGLIRVSRKNPRIVGWESGAPVYLMGVNILEFTALGKPLPPDRTDRCVRQIERLAAAGGNFIRLRMDSWWFAVDNPSDSASGFLGAGRFNQRACLDVDRLFAACERLGVQVMLCLENANATVNDPREVWRKRYNPYAAKNGGPCARMEEFWTNEIARDLMRRKIRYCVARWGASPSLAMWEFFNEVALRDRAQAEPVAKWHAEMAQEFKRLDPYAHLVTTSAMGMDAQAHEVLWSVDGLDVVQVHDYSRMNTAELYDTAQQLALTCKKPFLIGEFGMRAAEPGAGGRFKYAQDVQGMVAHLGHWSSAMSLAAGTALDWYVSGYVDALNLWPDFTGLKAFLSDLPRDDAELAPITATGISMAPGRALPEPGNVVIAPQPRWEKSPCAEYVLQEDGGLSPAAGLNGFLWGTRNHADLRQPPTFVVKYPKRGRFVLHVTEVVGRGPNPVRIILDGKPALEQDLVCAEGKGERWEARQPGPQGNLSIFYNRDLAIEVPAGEHKVSVDNLGRDRLVAEYRFEGCATRERQPEVMVVGLKHSRGAHVWICNKTWGPEALIGLLKTVPARDFHVALEGLSTGPAHVEWWNPASGDRLRTESAEVHDGRLDLSVPELPRDLACKVRYKGNQD